MRTKADIWARWAELVTNEPDSDVVGPDEWLLWLGEIKGLAYALGKKTAFERKDEANLDLCGMPCPAAGYSKRSDAHHCSDVVGHDGSHQSGSHTWA